MSRIYKQKRRHALPRFVWIELNIVKHNCANQTWRYCRFGRDGLSTTICQFKRKVFVQDIGLPKATSERQLWYMKYDYVILRTYGTTIQDVCLCRRCCWCFVPFSSILGPQRFDRPKRHNMPVKRRRWVALHNKKKPLRVEQGKYVERCIIQIHFLLNSASCNKKTVEPLNLLETGRHPDNWQRVVVKKKL